MTLEEISYDKPRGLDKVEERLKEVQTEFDNIRRKYTKGLRKYQFWLGKEDKNKLVELVCEVLPLSFKIMVQPLEVIEEYRERVGSLVNQCQDLTVKIIDMSSDYVNTSTKRIGYSKPIWKEGLSD